jgi:hypothetical protein
MNQKTPTSFLPFLALAVLLCLAAVVAVYTQISLTNPPAAPTAEEITRITPTVRQETTAGDTLHASSAAAAYPAMESPTASPTSSAAAHGYPAPNLDLPTHSAGPKAVTTEDPSGTPTYINFLPVIMAGQYPFALQSTGVIATQGFSGCNWTGVAGQVFDLSGNPLKNLIVHMQGSWNGKPISVDSISGSSDEYGPAGYVFVLGTQLLASSNTLSIQLMDANHKNLSLPIPFSTYSDCAHNLILVNLIQKY